MSPYHGPPTAAGNFDHRRNRAACDSSRQLPEDAPRQLLSLAMQDVVHGGLHTPVLEQRPGALVPRPDFSISRYRSGLAHSPSGVGVEREDDVLCLHRSGHHYVDMLHSNVHRQHHPSTVLAYFEDRAFDDRPCCCIDGKRRLDHFAFFESPPKVIALEFAAFVRPAPGNRADRRGVGSRRCQR